jgi:hypothetical protein
MSNILAGLFEHHSDYKNLKVIWKIQDLKMKITLYTLQ